jgi:hypothetical protein
MYAQAWIETELGRAIGAEDLTGIAHIEKDVRVILRRFVSNALELAAAYPQSSPCRLGPDPVAIR